jgi:16S rRNA C967 or C1407 C5-methylase (RsmB/RsmF family)
MGKRRKKSGEELFEDFYGRSWGKRWPLLKEALLKDVTHYKLEEGLNKAYYLDEASLYPARELDIQEGERVLDMCAAPGGKSLIIARALKGSGSLTVNDTSPARRQRLRTVLKDHLPHVWQKNIRITAFDASLWYRYEKNCYDKILLDAPCSSERHVLNSPEHLKRWSPARVKGLAPRQFALLCSALEVVKPGGLIVYSTCALAHEENDMIIERLEKKRQGRFRVEKIQNPGGDISSKGCHILPDKKGLGPIYYSRIKKII